MDARRSDSLIGCKLFAGIARDRLGVLERQCRFQRAPRDGLIVNHTDPTTDVYFVLHGRVRVTMYSRAGREVILRDFGTGDYFGELAAIDGLSRTAAVVALVESVLAAMPAAVFWDALHEHRSIAEGVLKRLAGFVRTLNERVLEFSTLGVRNRIHAELLRLARDSGEPGPAVTIRSPPTHAELASRVSTHREAVTRELGELVRLGLLERRGNGLVITNLTKLERLVRDVGER
jgi:CRP/FNR family transcriptional regulator, cyclic AMP receptor protein